MIVSGRRIGIAQMEEKKKQVNHRTPRSHLFHVDESLQLNEKREGKVKRVESAPTLHSSHIRE